MRSSRILELFSFSVFLISLSFVFTLTQCKTVTSSANVPSTSSSRASETSGRSVFMSVAKSLVTEALSQFRETARRNPRLGFNITMLLPPQLLPGNGTATNGSLPFPSLPGLQGSSLFGTTAQLGILGLKGAALGIKTAVLQVVVVILFIIFLLAGIAYFACNIGIISCSSLGGLGGLGGGHGDPLDQFSSLNPFSRQGLDYPAKVHRTTSAVYNALDESQKKYS